MLTKDKSLFVIEHLDLTFCPSLNLLGMNQFSASHGLVDKQNMRKRKGNTMIDCLLSLQETHETQHDYYTDIVIKGFVVVTRK
ncbi:hypothetical protein IGI04_006454 [Brassica rapa subsp. trilocularis]|uniref:Uncharacterized protein n=1 Tax=Brassica rapa subsp. trilocularis TaxID=1813537 RepID=A0ABQ7NGW9_BRACM|nr:hypothetical protein IGI04_006454 [Brassica rapa subsp. trilocularis]